MHKGTWLAALAASLLFAVTARAAGGQEITTGPTATAAARDPVDIRGIWKGDGLDEKKAVARGLDVKQIEVPKKTKNVSPVYPAEAFAAGETGTVGLECRIDTDGTPRACKVIRHVSPLLDRAALTCVVQWRYSPLTVGGEPRAALVELRVSFQRS